MTDGSITPEFGSTPNDVHQVKVIDPENIFNSLDRRGLPLIVSETKFRSTVFASETTDIQLSFKGDDGLTEDKYVITTKLIHDADELALPSHGFYDLTEIDTIKDLMKKQGLEASILTRKRNVRNLVVEKDGLCVAIDLGAEPIPGDLIYGDPDLENIPDYVSPQQMETNEMILMFTIDKDSIFQDELMVPRMPETKEEFAKQLKTYAEIYQAFLNVMLIEEGVSSRKQVVEFKVE